MGAKKISAGQIDENHASSSQIQWVSARTPFTQTKNGLSGSVLLISGLNPARETIKYEYIKFRCSFFQPGRILNFYPPHSDKFRTRTLCTGCFLAGKVGFGGYFGQIWSILEKKNEKNWSWGRKRPFFWPSEAIFGKNTSSSTIFLRFPEVSGALNIFSLFYQKKTSGQVR